MASSEYILLGARCGAPRNTDTGIYYTAVENYAELTAFETAIGRTLAIDHHSVAAGFDGHDATHTGGVAGTESDKPFEFPDVDRLNLDIAKPRITMLSWMMVSDLGHKSTSGYSAADILAGTYDAKINAAADAIKALSTTVLIRLANELAMSGDRGTFYGNIGIQHPFTHINNSTREPAGTIYKNVWRYIWQKFADRGVANVQWVWCPGIKAFAGATGQISTNWTYFYPGDDYVDWIGVDHYQKVGSTSIPFCNTTQFQTFYNQVVTTGKPLAWCETAANSDVTKPGTDNPQAVWWASVLSILPGRFPAIRMMCCWNLPGSAWQAAADASDEDELVFDGSYQLSANASGGGLEEFVTLANDTAFSQTALPDPLNRNLVSPADVVVAPTRALVVVAPEE